MFKYKTRGMSSPQGKRRVYFTCHPDDYEKYFEQISTEVLKITDCAIWYNEDESYDDIDTDLGQINLFVIPVTTKLLTKPCRAINIDIPFALKKHIPILPLVQERGLDELFTSHFGDLQYLDRNAHDETTISFEEKLKKYLNSVLIGDELATKVRAAFDAYIFLSYRKKDRKYANELMRLIHKNEICRDIAIWYDEYLVPGENFNEAISDALKKSDLFALVVTPNLVNEINYVQTVEYPEAEKQNKPIIPAELVKTDYNELSDKYPKIPNCVNAHDEITLSKTLESALVTIAYEENDTDPQHNFFIGLAYLDGIDVEVNHERALSLIKSAAEADNAIPEAIEKLVSMYSEGHGVERNYHTAIEWLQKLVEYWEKKFQTSNNDDNYNGLMSALWKLGEQYYTMTILDKAETIYKRMLEVTDCVNSGPLSHLHNISAIYNKLGNVLKRIGNMDEAEKSYHKALTYVEQLSDKYKKLLVLQDFSVCYDRLSELYKDKGDFNKAEEFRRQCITFTEQLMNESETTESLRDLSCSYEMLGDLLIDKGERDDAENYYLKSLDLCERLAKGNESIEARHNLMAIYSRLGTLYRNKEDLDASEQFWQKSLALSKQLAEETENMLERRSLLFNYGELGNIYAIQGNMDNAEKLYHLALSLNEKLVEETDSLELRQDLSTTYELLGNLYTTQNDFIEAENYFQKAITLSEQLVKEINSIKVRRQLSRNYSKFGDFYEKQDNLEEAEKYYCKGLVLRKQLVEEIPSVETYGDLADSYFNIAVIREDRELLEKALRIFTALANQCPQVTQYSFLKNMIEQMLEESE